MSSFVRTRGRWFLGIALGGAFGAAVSLTLAFSTNCANAQITPDATLPNNSIVTPQGNTSLIEGGTQAGGNLFHSFLQFSVPTGGTAFFNNAVDIQNIISRVTGGSVSNIDGLIRANGSANLFLINPNGINFGQNASLNVGGSFVGSTANAIQFDDLGIFSADTPDAPSPLLTINPSALLFNQLSIAAITNRSTAPAGPDPAGIEVTGLRVPDGRSLLLVGGNVFVDGGSLRAYEGRIELVGLATRGTLGLNMAGNILSLSVPEGVERADVSLTNGAQANVRAAGGGSIAINARNFNLAGESILRSGIELGLSASSGNAGDIEINATGETTVTDGSFIASVVQSEAVGNAGNINITTGSLTLRDATLNTSTSGFGDGGSIFVQASGVVDSVNGDIVSNVISGAVGNSGAISITAGSVSLTDGAQLQSSTFGSNATLPGGRGSGGGVNINARDTVTLAGVNQNGLPSGIFTDVESGAVGKGGDININAGSLSLTDGALLVASTSGFGDAGSVLIQAKDAVSVSGRGTIVSNVESGAVGNGGIINIQAGEFSLRDGAQLLTIVRGSSDTLPGGQGNAGNVNIRVSDRVTISDVNDFYTTQIATIVDLGAVGNGGDINIQAGAFFLTNAGLSGNTFGQGDAGSISVLATDSVSLANNGGFSSSVSQSAVGNGGKIDINARALSLTNESALFTGSSGQGNGGTISVVASDSVSLVNSSIVSGVSGVRAVGNGGNIDILAGTLSLTDSSFLNAFTNGKGDAGSITVRATDSVSLTNGSGFGSSVSDGRVGKGGDITIEAGTLSLTNGAQIDASTFGQGDAGNIQINATDSVSVFGTSSITGRSSALFTSTEPNSFGFGGDITVNTSIFRVSDGAVLDARTRNDRRGGDITVNAIRVEAINGGQLLTTTESGGSAGKITVNATDSVIVNGSDPTFNDRVAQFGTAVANSEAASGFFVRSESAGSAGDIEVTSPFISLDNSVRLIAESASGNGGGIILQVGDVLLLRRGSLISATAGTAQQGGDGGNITINAPSGFIVAVSDEDSNIIANAFSGSGGRVGITARGVLGIQPRLGETPLSDITASSQFGVNGDITIDTTVVDFSLGLVELPTAIADSGLIASNCAAFDDTEGSNFIVTGRGGLPPSPDEPLTNDVVWSDTRLTAIAKRSSEALIAPQNLSETAPKPPLKPEAVAIVRATGWVSNNRGEVTLISHAPNTTGLGSTDATCPTR